MIKDKKGEGGFMEAIMGLMVVTIALTAFLGLLAYTNLGEIDERTTLNTEFIEKLGLKEGKLSGETHDHMESFIERNGLNGARLTVIIAGTLSDASLTDSVGITDGNNVDSINGTFPIESDDGRTFVASYEVVYWWD